MLWIRLEPPFCLYDLIFLLLILSYCGGSFFSGRFFQVAEILRMPNLPRREILKRWYEKIRLYVNDSNLVVEPVPTFKTNLNETRTSLRWKMAFLLLLLCPSPFGNREPAPPLIINLKNRICSSSGEQGRPQEAGEEEEEGQGSGARCPGAKCQPHPHPQADCEGSHAGDLAQPRGRAD